MNACTRLIICSLIGISVATVSAADWPNWRGPNLNGISTETDWNPEALNSVDIVWKTDIGTGFSSVSIADGKAYVMGNINKKTDVVYCFEATSGKEVWRHEYKEPLEPKFYEGGSSSTPTVHDGKVYTLSKSGNIFCLDAATGEIKWQFEASHKKPTWGFASSGLVVDDKVIFNIGSAGLALNKDTGAIVWNSGKGEAGYATPVPFKDAEGKTLIAIFGKDELISVDAADGSRQWAYPWETKYDVNAADPVVVDDEILITSGYDRGATLLKMGSKPTPLWENKSLRSQMSGPVRIGDYLYGIDKEQLACVEWITGKQIWTEPKVGNGSLTAAGDKLIVASEKGYLLIAEATPEGFKEWSGAQVLSARCWAPPVLSGGHIYVRNSHGTLICVDVRNP